VTQDESHVRVGGLFAPGQRGKKNDHGKESVQKIEVTTGRREARVHERKHAQRKAIAGARGACVWEKDLT
jgi:hypothetical protein